MKHKSLREALTHLRRFPRVDIYVPLVTTITRISAIWRTRDRYGLHFDVYNGPAILIGAPMCLVSTGERASSSRRSSSPIEGSS